MTNIDEIALRVARSILRDAFIDRGGGVERWVRGVALTADPSSDGSIRHPHALRSVDLPIPLLRHHDYGEPVGEIRQLRVRDETLVFDARVVDRKFPWSEDVWETLKAGRHLGVSVCGEFCDDIVQVCGGASCRAWKLTEISIVEVPRHPAAQIHRVWERKTAIYLDGRPREQVFVNHF